MDWKKPYDFQREMPNLHVKRGNPMHQYILQATHLKSSSAEEDLGLLVDIKLHISQQCALTIKKVSDILGCISQSITSRSRKVILPPLFNIAEYLEHSVQF